MNSAIKEENGTLPSFANTTFADFRWMPHITSTGSGLIDRSNWNDAVYEQAEIAKEQLDKNYWIVEIDAES
ncbi:hypothetical protein QWJ34_16575 [Saccharibacillus sp. CPCC 101409]|uniref:hypothetical protein n=1 Tax=Saccharibacillus sp. CPCC 101409 TaxID=3058041 RepID=UPI00267113F1|nr:hypothetical protein [Saccharibacillus sp. CPCC 101409]MDO3411383.1 hypothetical protein [Saccharibacillus sp. CPCC 101409]